MTRPPLARLATGAAFLALALPAGASAAERQTPVGNIPVPDGQVQHTIRVASFETNTPVAGSTPWYDRSETWVSAKAARTVITDSRTGALRTECVETGTDHRCFNARENEITVFPHDDGEPGPVVSDSWQREARLITQQVEMGWFRDAGPTTYQGKPATILEDTEIGPRDAQSHITVIAEPGTNYPLRRTTTGRAGKQTFTQDEQIELREVLDPAQVDFAMSPHPGAKVTRLDQRKNQSASSARKRAAAKKRAVAKCRAKAKTKAAKKRCGTATRR